MARPLLSAIPLATLALVVSGCSGDPEPEVSHEGQVEFACALASHVLEETQGTELEELVFIGDDADPRVREVAAAGSLVGAAGGFVLADQEELSEAGRELFNGVNRIDVEAIVEGLERMDQVCAEVSEDSDPDVTEEGQIRYACALAEHVSEEHGAAESWGGLQEEHAWHEVASVAALFGGVNGQVLSEYPELSEASADVIQGVSTLNLEQLQSGLDDITEGCAEV